MWVNLLDIQWPNHNINFFLFYPITNARKSQVKSLIFMQRSCWDYKFNRQGHQIKQPQFPNGIYYCVYASFICQLWPSWNYDQNTQNFNKPDGIILWWNCRPDKIMAYNIINALIYVFFLSPYSIANIDMYCS